jgi:hypothetical protein
VGHFLGNSRVKNSKFQRTAVVSNSPFCHFRGERGIWGCVFFRKDAGGLPGVKELFASWCFIGELPK